MNGIGRSFTCVVFCIGRLFVVTVFCVSCHKAVSSGNDTGTDSSSDADADTGGDTDADADSDTDVDSDTGSDLDTDVNTDTDDDTDTDTDTDADSDSVNDSDTGSISDTDSETDTGTIDFREPEIHRPEAINCENVHSPEEPPLDAEGNCQQHSDCTEGQNGKCVQLGIGARGYEYYCVYDTCYLDAECEQEGMNLCFCSAREEAHCFQYGNCQVDADCGDGGYCSPSSSDHCGYYRYIDGFYCHTPRDTCMDDKDCTEDEFCNFDVYRNLWNCVPYDNGCMIG
ncbi:MAG: hypothetical protein JXR76_01500 [Deltaproteobacteria bacterium]|nr:hypothetical protein [Deltaproteobacteria bacterium]